MKKGQELQDGYSDLIQNCRVGRSQHGAHFCNLNLTSISYTSYSFWNITRKVSKLNKKIDRRAEPPDTFLEGNRTIQWLIHQNFVLIEQMVSDKKIFMWISHRVPC